MFIRGPQIIEAGVIQFGTAFVLDIRCKQLINFRYLPSAEIMISVRVRGNFRLEAEGFRFGVLRFAASKATGLFGLLQGGNDMS